VGAQLAGADPKFTVERQESRHNSGAHSRCVPGEALQPGVGLALRPGVDGPAMRTTAEKEEKEEEVDFSSVC
jgi:hypothetical protein